MFKQLTLLTTTVALFTASCQQAPKADKAQVTEPQAVQAEPQGHEYQLDKDASLLTWIGTKPTGEHKGVFKFSAGSVHANDSAVTAGSLEIDMKTLQNLDLVKDSGMKKKLEAELNGPNFFDVEKYPTAKFVITEISSFHAGAQDKEVLLKDATHLVKGNLTLKDSTKNISFPAKIVVSAAEVNAEANFNIDRTQWGITYRADQSLQDKLINSMVNIRLNIKAKR
ncbi:YceI family protein [Chitinophaga horti]|uniref:YceI family protein n=1 Tax=Chitinophaga horti TaxID=2920382 RepID=A0ABY6IY83_9BACT|nr:YceI family protein [Chitinophaga horti]UYQ92333.1 YceI family protein [Chitinophaga horti]